jgi:predicted  nucleic acid-binding Zn-ribbon protein
MTDAERDFLRYDGNRAYAERSGSTILVGVAKPYGVEKQDATLKKPGGLQMHQHTSREGEQYMLEEAAIRIQRAFRMRKKAKVRAEYERSAITRDDPDAMVDADVFDAAYRGEANTLRVMLSRGASINAMGAYGQYPLHYAVAGASIQCVALLLEHSASVNVQDAKGDTPLHIAARSGDIELIRILCRHRGDRSARNYAGKTPRAIARRYGDDLAVQELAFTLITEEDMRTGRRGGTIMTLDGGSDPNNQQDDEDDELTKISMRELDTLRRDLEQWMQTAKRAKAKERLAAKRAHNWEQQYHSEIEPLKDEVKRQEQEIEIYKIDLEENYRLHQGAKDAINEAEMAKHAMFLQKRQAEFNLAAVGQQMKDAERGIEYTRERMSQDMSSMEQERDRYRDESRQISSQMEDYMGQVKKLQMQKKVDESAQKEDKKLSLDAQQQMASLQNRFDKVKDARERLAERVKDMMEQVTTLKGEKQQLQEEVEMMREMGIGGGGGGGGGRRRGGGGRRGDGGGKNASYLRQHIKYSGYGLMQPRRPEGGGGGRRNRRRDDNDDDY